MSEKRLRIPHEDVRLTADEIAISQTRTFQRLFDLKQLGLAYLVYPNATHTRGIHSIRCVGEAAKILDGLARNGMTVSDDDRASVRAAALLHDIGHIPFSHTLEDEHQILSKHDRPNRLNKVLEALKTELQTPQIELVDKATPILFAIAEADLAKYPQNWRSDLVGNTVCADLLAYITADAEAAGIEKRSGHYRIYEYFAIHDDRLCIQLTKKGGFRSDIVSAIMDLLDMRYSLTERVIFHHAKCVASALLARASYLCGLSDDDEEELLTLGDEGFFSLLDRKAQSLLLSHDNRERGEAASQLLRALRARRLYKRIFKVGCHTRANWDASRSEQLFCQKWQRPDNVEELLSATERQHSLPLGSLALWCPPQKSGMKLVQALIIWEQTTGLHAPIPLRAVGRIGDHFARVANRIKAIEDQYLDLWAFWVVVDSKYVKHAPEIVGTLQRKLEIECDPLFRETYLAKEIEGFESRNVKLARVRERLADAEGPVLQSIEQLRALTGDTTVDDATIDHAIEEEFRNRTQPSPRPSSDTPLFPDGADGSADTE